MSREHEIKFVDGVALRGVAEDVRSIGAIRDGYLGIAAETDSSIAWEIASILSNGQKCHLTHFCPLQKTGVRCDRIRNF